MHLLTNHQFFTSSACFIRRAGWPKIARGGYTEKSDTSSRQSQISNTQVLLDVILSIGMQSGGNHRSNPTRMLRRQFVEGVHLQVKFAHNRSSQQIFLFLISFILKSSSI